MRIDNKSKKNPTYRIWIGSKSKMLYANTYIYICKHAYSFDPFNLRSYISRIYLQKQLFLKNVNKKTEINKNRWIIFSVCLYSCRINE